MVDFGSLTIGLGVGVVIGGVVAWMVAARMRSSLVDAAILKATERQMQELAAVRALHSSANSYLAAANVQLEASRKEAADQRADYEKRLAETNSRAAHAEKGLEEQRKLLQEAEKKLLESFKALSVDALTANNKQFLELAKANFETLQKQAEGDLGKKQEAIDAILKPMGEALKKYEEQLGQLEVKREKAYASMEEQLKGLGTAQSSLMKETTVLANALRNPSVRGRWGELTLQRVAELAGMVEHCDFTTQETVAGEGGSLRPDMLVNLPSGRRVAVDSKVPLNAYLEALAEGASPEARAAALEKHASAFRGHLNTLSGKAYWKALGATPEFVVLFVPGEPFLSAALEADRTLIEDGAASKVLIATPTTLIATLLAVAHGWREHHIAENAEEIRSLGAQLYDRLLKFGTEFGATGKALGRAVDAYNKAVGSYEGRLAPTARKFQDLGAAAREEMPDVEPVDKHPRGVDTTESSVPVTPRRPD